MYINLHENKRKIHYSLFIFLYLIFFPHSLINYFRFFFFLLPNLLLNLLLNISLNYTSAQTEVRKDFLDVPTECMKRKPSIATIPPVCEHDIRENEGAQTSEDSSDDDEENYVKGN